MIKREDRAKQFAPFESLNGLRQALRAKEWEHERIERMEISEERAARINKALQNIERGTRVKATYYNNGYYIDVEGIVSENSAVYSFVKIGDGKIFYDDLYDLTVIERPL